MTLREIHERCRARHSPDEYSLKRNGYICNHCDHLWPCADYWDAVAAIRALDEADRYAGSEGPYRLVPDPAPPTENT